MRNEADDRNAESADSSKARTPFFPRPPELTDAIAIAAIPLLGYGGAFRQELGYCRHFGVPVHLIEVTWGTAILFGVILAFVTVASWQTMMVRAFTDDPIIGRLLVVVIVAFAGPLLFAILSVTAILLAIIAVIAIWRWVRSARCQSAHRVPSPISQIERRCIAHRYSSRYLGWRAINLESSALRAQANFLTNEDATFIFVSKTGDALVFCGYDAGPRQQLNATVKVISASEVPEHEAAIRSGPVPRQTFTPKPGTDHSGQLTDPKD